MGVTGGTDVLRPRWIGVGAGAFVLTLVVAIPAFTIIVALAPQGAGDTLLSRLSVGASVIGFTILATAGSVLLHREPRDPMGWLLTGAGLAQLISTLTLGFVPFALSAGAPFLIKLTGLSASDLALGASVGIALSGPSTSTIDALVGAADSGLYVAKRGGRDQLAWAENQDSSALSPR